VRILRTILSQTVGGITHPGTASQNEGRHATSPISDRSFMVRPTPISRLKRHRLGRLIPPAIYLLAALNYLNLAISQIFLVGGALKPVFTSLFQSPDLIWELTSEHLVILSNLVGSLIVLTCVPLLLLRRSISYIVIYFLWFLLSSIINSTYQIWVANALVLQVVFAQSLHLIVAVILWKTGQLKWKKPRAELSEVFR
jgi:hypothetical protein